MPTVTLRTDAVLRARQLHISRGGQPVLSAASIDVSPGETVALTGPSGAGKSTLLSVLCGLSRPDSGSVEVDGAGLTGATDARRSAMRLRDFGLVFQEDALLPELTLAENVSLPLRLLRMAGGPPVWTERAWAELTRLDIGELADRLPAEVSGGQLQRAAVARAVVHTPKVVLADEPTASLDERAARSAVQLLIELARERKAAVVVVTHDHAVATMCDRRLVLKEGRVEPASVTPMNGVTEPSDLVP